MEIVRGFISREEQEVKRRMQTGQNVVYLDLERELNRLHSELPSQEAKAASLARQIAQLDRQIPSLDMSEMTIENLKRDVAVNDRNYRTYLEKVEDARILEDLESPEERQHQRDSGGHGPGGAGQAAEASEHHTGAAARGDCEPRHRLRHRILRARPLHAWERGAGAWPSGPNNHFAEAVAAMYEKFYQFKKSPFRITPDPAFLYVSPSHKEAVASIVFGVEQRKGFIVVVGEVGVGKTTILRRYLARLDARRLSTAYVFNANVGFKDLLDTICRELGVTDKPDDVPGMVHRLHQLVIEEYRQRRNVVVVIDEAQNMPIETLENLRVLSNLDTSTDKLIQIVLLGQPELAATLDRLDLRQLKQRVAVRCTLNPYTDEESQAYIEHRLHTAGSSTSSVFSPGALRAIIKYGEGIPRRINVVCDSALVTGLGYQAKPVTAAIVREVICDLEGKPRAARRSRVRGSVAALLVVGAAFSVSAYRGFQQAGPYAEADNLVPSATLAAPASATLPVTPSFPSPWSDSRGVDAGGSVMNTADLSPAEPSLVDTRVVRQGDTLLRMTMDVYGFPLDSVFQRILERNPRISNVNWIQSGTTIRFPDVSDLRRSEPRPTRGGLPTP